ncbi:transporter substrate-binding domain-containing protein [Rhizobiales bacterium L72]|uniref:Transporter substrate-binding domain-containing protein n=1 Tax=Propylenella binzhouense TaxID=2555902 RepID=A0A964T417_9HYPH|nr:transporter substrate-binding domain-containing protein [Propylenella binzhouense]
MRSLRHALLILAMLLPLAALPASAGAAPDADAATPAAQDPVVIPNFWDPRARLERPTPATIGAIRFLMTDDFPPFSYRDRRGVLMGFNVDLVRAICDVLEVRCAVQTRPFGTLGQALLDRAGDAVIAGLANDGSKLLATNPYLKIPGRFVARKEGTFDPAAKGLDAFIGTVCGTAHQAYLQRFFPSAKAVCYLSLRTALDQVKEGTIPAVFADAVSLAFWLDGPEAAGCCRFAGGPYLDDRYFGDGLTILVRPDDRRLRAALDYALREVHQSGRYEEIYLRYFPVGLF